MQLLGAWPHLTSPMAGPQPQASLPLPRRGAPLCGRPCAEGLHIFITWPSPREPGDTGSIWAKSVSVRGVGGVVCVRVYVCELLGL